MPNETSSDLNHSFNVHGVVYVQDDGNYFLIHFHSRRGISHLTGLIFVGTIEPIDREIRDFASKLYAVKDEQDYIALRERRHRKTAESTNGRVVWWSILQGLVLVSDSVASPLQSDWRFLLGIQFCVCGWQVYYLQVSEILSPSSLIETNMLRPLVIFRGQEELLSATYLLSIFPARRFPITTSLKL